MLHFIRLTIRLFVLSFQGSFQIRHLNHRIVRFTSRTSFVLIGNWDILNLVVFIPMNSRFKLIFICVILVYYR